MIVARTETKLQEAVEELKVCHSLSIPTLLTTSVVLTQQRKEKRRFPHPTISLHRRRRDNRRRMRSRCIRDHGLERGLSPGHRLVLQRICPSDAVHRHPRGQIPDHDG